MESRFQKNKQINSIKIKREKKRDETKQAKEDNYRKESKNINGNETIL